MGKPKLEFGGYVFDGNGASISMLSALTSKDRTTVRKRILGLKAIGTKKNHPTYNTQEALQAIYKAEFIDPAIKQDSETQTVTEQKAYYDAKILQLNYETRVSGLIPADVCRKSLANYSRVVISTLKDFPDLLEAKAGLNTKQKEVVASSIQSIRDILEKNIIDDK